LEVVERTKKLKTGESIDGKTHDLAMSLNFKS